MKQLDQLCINTLRFLAIDAIQKANSGHPGAPLGATPVVYTLWDRFLKHNPQDPKWFNRDRFILSAGHASAMLYSLLHTSGYDVSLQDMINFRQLNSKTAGHPEYGLCPGVEATTGPLGQGIAMGVGMAIAESHLSAVYNRPSFNIIDHYTYVFCSDGDMMEGICSEAASLAGTLKLNKLICLYDDNKISIEGDTQNFFNEDIKKRFQAYGWQVLGPLDGNDTEETAKAIATAQKDKNRPSLIICSTTIGFGSPNRAGSAKSHGEPLGTTEVAATKKALGWDENKHFYVPTEVKMHMSKAVMRGQIAQKKWRSLLKDYQKRYPTEAKTLSEQLNNSLLTDCDNDILKIVPTTAKATREYSGLALNYLADKINNILGGSADLGPSNKTILVKESMFSATNRKGRNLQFGVREQAMGAIINGIALHSVLRPYCATFLAFYDYMRAPVRLAALMNIPSVFVFSHDSIGMGEDGPTHQPVEQILGLRSVPNLVTLRPADGYETVLAWQIALKRQGPTAIVTTRQQVNYLDRNILASANDTYKGAYVLWQSVAGQPDLIIIATGSEVSLALSAAQEIAKQSAKIVRLVSMPSWELFEAQTKAYQKTVLPEACKKRISVEAASTIGWRKYAAINMGVDYFGISAPADQVYQHFGLTVENIIKKALKVLK